MWEWQEEADDTEAEVQEEVIDKEDDTDAEADHTNK